MIPTGNVKKMALKRSQILMGSLKRQKGKKNILSWGNSLGKIMEWGRAENVNEG